MSITQVINVNRAEKHEIQFKTEVPPPKPVAKVLKPSEHKLDVLVAEDNEVNQVVIKQILNDTGLSFDMVENGHLAIAKYKLTHPRLVLMDLVMPIMGGAEACREIREYEEYASIAPAPIVAVTAHSLKGDLEDCLAAGMDDYLPKPISPKKLMAKIQQWIEGEADKQKSG